MSTTQDGTTRDRDPEIVSAYDRLGRSLEAPVDVLARVEHRMRARRRRRVAVAGRRRAGPGGRAYGGRLRGGRSVYRPSKSPVADQPAGPVSTLAFTRADGSTYTFRDIEVALQAGPRLPAPAGGPARKRPEEGSGQHPARAALHVPGLPLDEVADGRTFTLPVDDSATEQATDDPVLRHRRGRPAGPTSSPARSRRSGTVEVTGASCGPTPSLGLRIDATLGSEVEQGSMAIAGELRR